MSYLAQYRLSLDGEFIGIVRQALIASATNVRGEAEDTPHHEQRVAMANQLYTNAPAAETIVMKFARLCSSNPQIADDAVVDGRVIVANIADGDLDYVIASNWDAIATGTL